MIASRRKRVNKRLRRKTQRLRRAYRKQHGGGENTRAGVFILGNNAGFFSTYFTLCKAYLYAKEKGADFLIDHDNWQYTYEKGWHDYFTTLQVYDTNKKYESVERFKHTEVDKLPNYSVVQYQQAIRDTFILKKDLYDKVDHVKQVMGGPYTSLYVRRGDKVAAASKEMDLLTIKTILGKTDIQNDARNLFIQTDDHRVVEEVGLLLPSCKLYTTTPKTQHGSVADENREASSEEKKKHAEELFISTNVLLGGQPIWTDIRSNVGRFHKLFAFEKVRVYPDESAIANLSMSSIIVPYSSLL